MISKKNVLQTLSLLNNWLIASQDAHPPQPPPSAIIGKLTKTNTAVNLCQNF